MRSLEKTFFRFGIVLLLLSVTLCGNAAAQYVCITNIDNTVTISEYTGSGGIVAIPPTISGRTVSGIGSAAFYGCEGLTGVSVPDGVVSIGDEAFSDCTKLSKVTLGSNLTGLGEAVFYNCRSLSSLIIPAKINVIGGLLFYNCTNLTAVCFKGNAPRLYGTFNEVFSPDMKTVVYYATGTTGWSTTFYGRPTALWNPANLVLNPSFEVGGTAPASWIRGGSAIGSGTTTQNGTNSLRIATAGANAATRQTIAVKSGTTYTLSVWIQASGVTAGNAIFDTSDVYDGAGQGQFVISKANAGWTKYSGRFTATNSSVTLRMFTDKNFKGTVYFDSIELSPVIEPAVTNLALNPSFETGGKAPTSWIRRGSAVGSGMTAQQGTNSLRIATPGTNSMASQTIAITVGQRYDISVWINASGVTSGNVTFDTGDRYDAPGQGQFVITNANAGWTKYSGSFTATNNSVTLRMFPNSKFQGTIYFDNIVLTPAVGLPSPWQSQGIGDFGLPGNVAFSSGAFTIKGSGKAIIGGADSFYFLHQIASGDCDIKVRVDSLTNTVSLGTAGRTGVMIRESLNSNASALGIWLTRANSVEFTYRTTTGGTTFTHSVIGIGSPYWLRIKRAGNSFSVYYGSTGTSWTQVGASLSVSMPTNTYMGMGLCSGHTNKLATAVISNVTATP